MSTNLLRDLLYDDDFDLVAHTGADMQQLLNAFELACTALGLTISLKKAVVIISVLNASISNA